MTVFWFQVGFGLFLIIILITLGIKFSKEKKFLDDEKILKIVREKLYQDGIDYFELESVVSLRSPNISTVITDAEHSKIAFEIDNDTGRILTNEKLVY